MKSEHTNRRQFVAGAAAMTLASSAMAKTTNKTNPGRVIGANDKINVAVIGTGGRGFYVADRFDKYGQNEKPGACQIVGVCDVYQKRVTAAKERFKCAGTLDYREILDRQDVDAVIVATPDHWHAPIALAAMDKGKDVHLEKPMCHTIDEVKALISTVKETGRVVQVGSQTTSGDQWWKARKAIADGVAKGGMIPKLETAIAAVEAGVEAVVIMDGRRPHAMLVELFTEHGAGTLICR
jgi:predicted dehydrogenase